MKDETWNDKGLAELDRIAELTAQELRGDNLGLQETIARQALLAAIDEIKKGSVTVFYTLQDLSVNGGYFVIHKDDHPKHVIEQAKKELRYHQDVVGCVVTEESPGFAAQGLQIVPQEAAQ